MINFIILEKEKKFNNLYETFIKKIFHDSKFNYKIIFESKYNKLVEDRVIRNDGFNIFLITVDDNNINVAHRINRVLSINTYIILLLNKKQRIKIKQYQNILPVSIIKKDNNMFKNLLKSIGFIYNKITKYKSLNFCFYDEIHRIYYDDIYYMKKEINTDYTTIYTKDNTYCIYQSIRNLENKLKDDIRFFKTHRSCIVNVNKIVNYDKKMNTIIFNNNESLNLVSIRRKKLLCERLLKDY